MAKGTCFFDFDIIQLAFKKGAELHIIPVIASPIDIIPDITPPTHMPEKALSDWWKYALTFTVALVTIIIVTTFVQKYRNKGER